MRRQFVGDGELRMIPDGKHDLGARLPVGRTPRSFIAAGHLEQRT